jgi:hypothetical protein
MTFKPNGAKMMYVLEKTTGGYQVVAQVHPNNVPADKKGTVDVANGGSGTVAIYEDKSWQSLPLTKRFEHPWPMGVIKHGA